MPNKNEVLKAHKLHPDWTSKQIAIAILGAATSEAKLVSTDGWVRRVAQREGLNLGKRICEPRPPRRDSIQALGRAARARGLTVKDICAQTTG